MKLTNHNQVTFNHISLGLLNLWHFSYWITVCKKHKLIISVHISITCGLLVFHIWGTMWGPFLFPITIQQMGSSHGWCIILSSASGVTGKATDITVLRLKHQAACNHGATQAPILITLVCNIHWAVTNGHLLLTWLNVNPSMENNYIYYNV